ncbi:metalloregulator ArsR/SmtB family transcription factor [Actinoplanes sp. KI2]|uniref:metalloregulator ArsR/SmtB family transcription factor n=1 Tax=Actinoplanes sp. KI2 TaxID=2983315 RepID=UPI00294FF9A7|nr:metalloregulator ArsR/SmtB family transcription factor [Actinoplanes sp. KI2]
MDEVAGAIADPVRRQILLMLRAAPLSAGQIADRFAISRPAVSRHLRVLREAGLVRDTADGRRRVYELVTAPLDELAGWLTRLTRPAGWQHHFDALETEVHRTRRERQAAAGHRPSDPAQPAHSSNPSNPSNPSHASHASPASHKETA